MEEIILVGYGGHAQSIADCIERDGRFRIIGYTEKEEQPSPYVYLGTDDVLKSFWEQGIKNVAVGIGYLGKGDLRERIFYILKSIGFQFPVIIDPSATVSRNARLGEGSFVGKKAVVNAGATIGKMCIINTAAVIEHGCRVGQFSHIAVGSILCGQVTVGEGVLVGANATVIQGQNIPSRKIVPAGVTVRGNNHKKF